MGQGASPGNSDYFVLPLNFNGLTASTQEPNVGNQETVSRLGTRIAGVMHDDVTYLNPQLIRLEEGRVDTHNLSHGIIPGKCPRGVADAGAGLHIFFVQSSHTA